MICGRAGFLERKFVGFGENSPSAVVDLPVCGTPARLGEQRRAPRFSLVLRTARLVADGREYICVLRDISATGVKIKLFHPLPDWSRLQLELDGGERHDMTLAWAAGDHAGLRFVDAVGATGTTKGGAHPRRPLRIAVDRPAVLLVHGETAPARLVNLSQQGACIETGVHLRLRERLRLDSGPMGEMSVTVCWRDRPRYGLVFEQGFKLDQLARMLNDLRAPAVE
jgi:hypothetical protein